MHPQMSFYSLLLFLQKAGPYANEIYSKIYNSGTNEDESAICWMTLLLAHLSRRLKGELIVYRSIRRPWVRGSVRPCVNIFKLEYLRNQWANRNQILSEASLGWGIDCIRF